MQSSSNLSLNVTARLQKTRLGRRSGGGRFQQWHHFTGWQLPRPHRRQRLNRQRCGPVGECSGPHQSGRQVHMGGHVTAIILVLIMMSIGMAAIMADSADRVVIGQAPVAMRCRLSHAAMGECQQHHKDQAEEALHPSVLRSKGHANKRARGSFRLTMRQRAGPWASGHGVPATDVAIRSFTRIMLLDAGQPAVQLEQPSAADATISYPAAFFAAAQANSAFDMLARLPGFTFDPGEAVRGFGGAAGNVLIDSQRPSTKADTLESQLRRIPATSVERIDVIRGGGAGVDMQGRAVQANIILKSTAFVERVATGSGQLYTYGRFAPSGQIDLAKRRGKHALVGSIRYFNRDGGEQGSGVLQLRDRDGALLIDVPADKKDIDSGIELRASGQWPAIGGIVRLNAALDRTLTDKAERYFINPGQNPQTTLELFRRLGGELGGDFVRSIAGRTQMKIVGLHNVRDQDYRSTSDFGGSARDFRQDRRSAETIARLSFTSARTSALTVEAGADGAINILDGDSRLSLNGAAVAVPSSRIAVSERRGELFASANWRASPSLQFEGGLRYETSTITQTGETDRSRSFSFAKPRLTATLTPARQLQLRLRGEREVGQLNFADFVATTNLNTGVVNAGGAALQPERRWVIEAAIERQFWRSGIAILTLRHAELEQVVDQIPVGDFNAPGNIGRGRRTTVIGDLTMPLRALGMPGGLLKGRAQYITSQVRDPTTGLPRLISRDRPFSGSFTITNDMPALKSTWLVSLTSGNRETSFFINEVQTIRRGAMLDLSWEYRPTRRLTLLAQATNITSFPRDRVRELFAGRRGPAGPDTEQFFRVRVPASLFLRARQSF
jgi:hypothetical protein